MCLVEIGQKKPDGTVAMQPKLVPGCQTPVKDGTVIVADSEKVKAAQKATLEYLLLESSARLPDLRPGGRVLPAGLQLQLRPRLQPAAGAEGTSSRTRTTSASRSRCSPIAASCAAAACGSRARSAARPSCRSSTAATTKRSTSSPASRATTSWRATWSILPGRRAVQQGLSVQAARVVAEDGEQRLPGCSTGCSIHVDQNEDHVYRLRPRRESAGAGRLHVRRRPVRLEVHSQRRAAAVARAAERRQGRVARLGCRAAGGAGGAGGGGDVAAKERSRPCFRRG